MIISRRRFIALASAFTIGILSKKVNLNFVRTVEAVKPKYRWILEK